MEGPAKKWQEWRKVWTDHKCGARGRAAKCKAARGATGNVVPVEDLSERDQKVLTLIGTASSLGLPLRELGHGENNQDLNIGALKSLTEEEEEEEDINQMEDFQSDNIVVVFIDNSLPDNLPSCSGLSNSQQVVKFDTPTLKPAATETPKPANRIRKRIQAGDEDAFKKSKKVPLSASLEAAAARLEAGQKEFAEGLTAIAEALNKKAAVYQRKPRVVKTWFHYLRMD